MRRVTVLLALLIALSVAAAPLLAAYGDAHASGGGAHADLAASSGAGSCESGSLNAPGEHRAVHHDAVIPNPCGGASESAGQVGLCEMAMCHPFISVRGVHPHRVPLAVLVSGAWGADALVDDGLSARIERPPRA
ncbi:hypothetical protein [Salinarimonas rosea]|uniref:hypothetical protein n=1 Tax=Salinarimonas rosea TaxID=552063 RepID=UPI0003F74527|nr:hypothetical protein [Salinarimonas rosea]